MRHTSGVRLFLPAAAELVVARVVDLVVRADGGPHQPRYLLVLAVVVRVRRVEHGRRPAARYRRVLLVSGLGPGHRRLVLFT